MLIKEFSQTKVLNYPLQGGKIMDERERILELVREGVLSVDEGLDLLESIAKKESKQTEQREFTSEKPTKDSTVEPEDSEASTDDVSGDQEEFESLDQEEMKQFEDELQNIAN